MDITIEQKKNMKIRITDHDNGGFIESQSVEANIQFTILEKLEEIRRAIVSLENTTKDGQKI